MDHYEMLQEIDSFGEGLTEWEIEFVENLVTRYEQVGDSIFTGPTVEKLEQIYDERVL